MALTALLDDIKMFSAVLSLLAHSQFFLLELLLYLMLIWLTICFTDLLRKVHYLSTLSFGSSCASYAYAFTSICRSMFKIQVSPSR